jgi:hypothetical protein
MLYLYRINVEMNRLEAINLLRLWDQQGRFVFTSADLRKLFAGEKAKTFSEGLARLVKAGVLIRVARGVYLNPHAQSKDAYTVEHIAKALRRGQFNYVSLESALSQYGAISQIPVDRLTIMTTGREGVYNTPYGTIEFTHTSRGLSDILEGIQVIPEHPLKLATKEAAWRDLKRVGRNTNMVDTEVLNVI